jgi:hypothetical protein
MDSATYLYCAVKAARRPRLAGAPGGVPHAGAIDAADVGSGLWLILSDVPLERYGPAALDTALADMRWVSGAALAHDAVVEHFARIRTATVIPMKMFTMFTTRDKALDSMRQRRRELARVAKRIEGCQEWGVRVLRVPGDAARVAPAEAAASGAAFLAAKKKVRDEARAGVQAALEAAEQAFEVLAATARDATRREDAPQGATTPPLVDAAFLVPAARRAAFKSAARRCAAACRGAGASLILTGPWPAYNFVEAARQ